MYVGLLEVFLNFQWSFFLILRGIEWQKIHIFLTSENNQNFAHLIAFCVNEFIKEI